ncbi:MAG: YbhB/YbcL family Raf kinase inhibitor-like protein, partial [Ilumatobacteraceae bacterium]
ENSTPVSAIEDDVGWRGPCPPAGTTHHYRFTLYALAEHIELPTGSTAADLRAAIDATSLSVAERTGVYVRT